jgi:hypothetical protein
MSTLLSAAWLAACRPAPATPPAPPAPFAQWVWTEADLEPLTVLRAAQPGAVAGVHIATLRRAELGVRAELHLAPTLVEAPRALVIRLDDDLHPLFDALPDDGIAAALAAPLTRLLALADARGASVELQLDYDVPVRLLPRWAAVLRVLRGGCLAGRPLWVTSLVAHLQRPDYGALLSGVVDGHILQVFDTGDHAPSAPAVLALADAAGLPYRWGLGAFERGAATTHRAWFQATAACAGRCQARWVFPAGQPWADLR